MDNVIYIAAVAGLVGLFIIGGSLFAFSSFIMAALKRVPAAEGARAMQQINKTVFTPWFMGPFFAMALLAPAGLVLAILHTEQPWALQLGAASAVYGVGVFLVTAFGNVPLNNKLTGMDAADPAGTDRFLPPPETVTVLVLERGLFPGDPDDATRARMAGEVLQFVRDHARVFVDVKGLADRTSGRLPVEVAPLDPLWRETLGGVFDAAKEDPRASLRLDIDEADSTLAVLARRTDDHDSND